MRLSIALDGLLPHSVARPKIEAWKVSIGPRHSILGFAYNTMLGALDRVIRPSGEKVSGIYDDRVLDRRGVDIHPRR
jgi:hypothetical protein